MKLISHVSMMYCFFMIIIHFLLLSIYLLVTDGDGGLIVDVVVFIITVHVVETVTGQENA